MKVKKKVLLHQKIHHHLRKHFHRHIHKVLHITNHLHHNFFHTLELVVVCIASLSTFGSLGFANLTGVNQDLYTDTAAETSQHLLTAMQNPISSLKQGNIISIWSMDMDVENTFAKGYCTYGAARISPEFFPFTDEKTQQRTWGGNAVDRCKNASDTGYKIGSVPSQGALVVYDAGGRFGSYGHVGKVLHYDKTLKKIIVRDMARVARGSMSDRREDLNTANIKCYIYNSKTAIPIEDPIISPTTGTTITTGTNTVTPQTGNTTPTTPTVISPETPVIVSPTEPNTPVVVEPIVVVPPPPSPISQISENKKLVLELENISDIAQHFITQNDFALVLVTKSPLKLGEVAKLTFEIKDKKTGEPYSGLLPFSFNIFSTNDTLQEDISNIQLVNNGKIDISFLGQKIGIATVVIHMDGTKISEFSIEVK